VNRLLKAEQRKLPGEPWSFTGGLAPNRFQKLHFLAIDK
jgi:hypothetical protein